MAAQQYHSAIAAQQHYYSAAGAAAARRGGFIPCISVSTVLANTENVAGHFCTYTQIVVALDEMHSIAVLRLLVFFFCEVAVGVGASVERDKSAPAQTVPQQAGFGLTERLLFFLGLI